MEFLSESVSLFFASFLAATILPFSSEVALFSAIKLGVEPWQALIACSLGNCLAVGLNYTLGYFLHEKVYTKLSQKKIGRRALFLTKKHAFKALFLSWLPAIGDPITLAAGLVRFPLLSFLVVSFSLRILRYIFILYISM